MIYLLAQLIGWILLTVGCAAIAGWSFRSWRTAADDAKARRDRANLMRDLSALVGEGGGQGDPSLEWEREREASRRLADVREGRITELERALEASRTSASESAARAAELQRALDEAEAEREQVNVAAMDVAHEPVAPAEPVDPENDPALLAWRLRYFEQRVQFLESEAREDAPAVAEPVTEPPVAEWRARVAEARAAHAENEVRALMTPPPETAEEQVSPFAANADIDVLLRWRMLYLERRVAHMQARSAAEAAPEPAVAPAEANPDSDRWKWRARYLEARARHLEQRLTETVARPASVIAPVAAPVTAAEPAPEPEEPAPPPAPTRRAKPPVLQAPRHGAPDDFTLIEGVSVLQQTTLYSLGVFHYDQIAAWSDEQVAWIDHYLRLRGRIDEEEWREQAATLAREGPAARRVLAEENV